MSERYFKKYTYFVRCSHVTYHDNIRRDQPPYAAVEAIEIELPEISSWLGIIEVSGEYFRPKSIGIMYREGTPVWLPANDIGQTIGLDLRKCSVQFEWEGHAFAR